MHKVIIDNPEPRTTPLSRTHESLFYGVITSLGRKGFITKEKGNGRFVIKSFQEINENSYLLSHESDDLKGLIIKICENPENQVFEFASYNEFLTWGAF